MAPRLSQSGHSSTSLFPRSFQPCAFFAVASPPREKRRVPRPAQAHGPLSPSLSLYCTRGRPKGRSLSHLPGFLRNFSRSTGIDLPDSSPCPLLSLRVGYSLSGSSSHSLTREFDGRLQATSSPQATPEKRAPRPAPRKAPTAEQPAAPARRSKARLRLRYQQLLPLYLAQVGRMEGGPNSGKGKM